MRTTRRFLSLLAALILCASSALGQQPTAGGGVPAQNFAGGGVPNGSNISVNGQFNVKNYGAVGDAQKAGDGVTNSTALITSATASFTAADVGKYILCVTSLGTTCTANNTKITAVLSATNINVSPNATATDGTCILVWYSHDDTAAFNAAFTAAKASNFTYADDTINGNTGQLVGTPPGNIYMPPGEYVISDRIYITTGTTAYNLAPGIIGAGSTKSLILLSPYLVPNVDARGAVFEAASSGGINLRDFSIDGMNFVHTNFQAGQAYVRFSNSHDFTVENVNIGNMASTGTGDSIFRIQSGGKIVLRNLNILNSSQSGAANWLVFLDQSTLAWYGGVLANGMQTLQFSNSNSTRSPNGAANVIEGVSMTECFAAAGPCESIVATTVTLQDDEVEGGNTGTTGLTVDGASLVIINNSDIGPFNNSNNLNAINIASGGVVTATSSTFRGNGTGAAIAGPAGAFFYDLGGNFLQNWTVGTCNNSTPPFNSAACTGKPAITPALAYSGGISPVFNISAGATTQIGGSQVVQGVVPTSCVATGSTGATCAFDAGSTNAAGRITITETAVADAALGTVSFNYSNTMGTHSTTCSANLATLAGDIAWAAADPAPIFTTASTTAAAFNWNNSAVNVVAGTYHIMYTCYGQ